jgi:hypothetical protein
MEEQTVLLAALMAGIVATTVTVLIEKYGGVLGGILGTIPTTIIPASIGMASEGGNDALIVSLAIVPAGMLINAIFLSVWALLPDKLPKTWNQNSSLIFTSIISLIIWAIVGLFTIDVIDRAIDKNYSPEEISIVGLVLVATLGIVMCWNLKPAPKGKNSVSKKILAARGIVAAMAIGIAVLISSLGNATIGRIGIGISSNILDKYDRSMVSPRTFCSTWCCWPNDDGGASVAMYSIIAMWSLIEYGLFIGSIIAWVGSIVVWSIPSFVFVNWRAKVTMANENY